MHFIRQKAPRIAVLLIGVVFGALLNQAVTADANRNTLPVEKLEQFAEVFELIKDSYVDEISPEEIMEKAIAGMVGNLDSYSAYFDEETLEKFSDAIAGKFGGIGIYIGKSKQGWVEVVSPIDGTPAKRAGFRTGDYVLKIDGRDSRDMSIDEAASLMRGEPGTAVNLELFRPGWEEAKPVTLIRAEISAPSVRAALIEEDYAYIRLSQFQPNSASSLIESLTELSREQPNLKGMLLDLRSNPGGDLYASIAVSSAWVKEGEIVVSDRGRTRDSTKTFRADFSSYRAHLDNHQFLHSIPLVVLVDGGSASASEIVAGALQDHKRALIVGEQTYGKGSVQTISRLRSAKNRSAVKMTTARYYTPDGRSIHGVGIEPDIVFAERENKLSEDFSERNGSLANRLKSASDEALSEFLAKKEQWDAQDAADAANLAADEDKELPNERSEDEAAGFTPSERDGAFLRALAILKRLPPPSAPNYALN